MPKTMRESFQRLKWTLFAVIIVFILGFVYFSGSGTGSRDSGQVIAQVGGDSISAVDFDRRYRAEVDRQQSNYQGKLSPELIRAMDLPRQVLEGMIDRLLRLEAARRLHLTVADEGIATSVMAFTAFQENGQFIGKEKYEKFLRASGYSPERFEEEVREGLLLEKYATLVKASVLVPEAEIQREFSTRNDKASIEYIKIPASRVESSTPATDAELKAYFEKNKERYRLPEQRRINYLLVDRAKVRAKTSAPEAELKSEYESRRSSFAVAEQVTVAHILIKADPDKGPAGDGEAKAEKLAEKARTGEDFGKLANENTEDPAGKGSGGQLPPFSRGQMVPEFEQAAFDMKPGEIRGPIKTQFGYHVIKLGSKTPPRTRTFEEVRPQLEAELAERRAQAETERRARELSEKLKGMRNASDDELRKLRDDAVTYDTTPWVSRTDAIPGIGANQRFSEEAWAGKLAQISSAPITTSRGPAFVKPAEQRPAGLPPFDEVKNKVAADYQAERRDREALEKLQSAAQELGSGGSLVALAARYETEVKTTPEFAPGGPVPDIGAAPELSTAVFATAKGQVGPPVPVPGGYVIFRVINRSAGDAKSLETQRAELADALRARQADRLLRASIQQMRADRKVTVNEELLKSFLPEPGGARRG